MCHKYEYLQFSSFIDIIITTNMTMIHYEAKDCFIISRIYSQLFIFICNLLVKFISMAIVKMKIKTT